MTRSREEKIIAGQAFTAQYQAGVTEMLANLKSENGGTIPQQALLNAYEAYSRRIRENLERERALGITFQPAFVGGLYGLVNGQEEVVSVQVQSPSGELVTVGLNPRLLLWTVDKSPIHTHVPTKDGALRAETEDKTLVPGELFCSFLAVSGETTNAEFNLTGQAAPNTEGYIYEGRIREVATVPTTKLTADKYKGASPAIDRAKPEHTTPLYIHQFYPQQSALAGVFILNAEGVEVPVTAVTANIYNGIQPKKPAQGDKVHDATPVVTSEARRRLNALSAGLLTNAENSFVVRVGKQTVRDAGISVTITTDEQISLEAIDAERKAPSFQEIVRNGSKESYVRRVVDSKTQTEETATCARSH